MPDLPLLIVRPVESGRVCVMKNVTQRKSTGSSGPVFIVDSFRVFLCDCVHYFLTWHGTNDKTMLKMNRFFWIWLFAEYCRNVRVRFMNCLLERRINLLPYVLGIYDWVTVKQPDNILNERLLSVKEKSMSSWSSSL